MDKQPSLWKEVSHAQTSTWVLQWPSLTLPENMPTNSPKDKGLCVELPLVTKCWLKRRFAELLSSLWTAKVTKIFWGGNARRSERQETLLSLSSYWAGHSDQNAGLKYKLSWHCWQKDAGRAKTEEATTLPGSSAGCPLPKAGAGGNFDKTFFNSRSRWKLLSNLFFFRPLPTQVETFPNLFVNPGAMVIVVPTAKGW